MNGKGYDAAIPREAIAALESAAGRRLPVFNETPEFKALERELAGIKHGTAWLKLSSENAEAAARFHVRDGRLIRYEIDREIRHGGFAVGSHRTYVPEPPAGGCDAKTK